MPLCRFTLCPQSPWSGKLRSDTLYGLVLWHVAEREGEEACAKLIAAFEANEPPFLLSSAMPADHLPMPVLPPISRQRMRDLASKNAEKDKDLALFELLRKLKKFRKESWLPLNAWQKHKNALSALALFAKGDFETEPKGRARSAFEPHVSINRKTGTAMEGQLFFRRLMYFEPGTRLHIYARADDPDWLAQYLEIIGELGFGRDASCGNGQFSCERDRAFEAESLNARDANASLLLSVCAAPQMEDLAGLYRVEVKRGKTGPGHANPFKKPFLMLQEGSILERSPEGPYVLRNINADRRIVQILQPLNLPCRLQAEEK